MGRELARQHPVEADLVIPVPDSGNYAALGFSEESGIPYDHAFVRNHYVGRTFLNPSQLAREFGVKVKLNIIKARVAGKRVVVVDDSIVRGTTARARVMNLRNAGAKEVHIRISCPPHRHPCHYGIDFPDPKDLIANQLSHDQITKYLQADSLGYLDPAGMVRATGRNENQFCMACFNGKYPVTVNPDLDKLIFERRRERADSLVAARGTAPRVCSTGRYEMRTLSRHLPAAPQPQTTLMSKIFRTSATRNPNYQPLRISFLPSCNLRGNDFNHCYSWSHPLFSK